MLADRTGIPVAKVKMLLLELANLIPELLVQNKRVCLWGVGTWHLKYRKGRVSPNHPVEALRVQLDSFYARFDGSPPLRNTIKLLVGSLQAGKSDKGETEEKVCKK